MRLGLGLGLGESRVRAGPKRSFKLAPGLLEPLKSQRVINAVIHDLSTPNWHEGAERVFGRDRVGYEFGKVVPTPAPAPASRGALKPANSPQHKAKKRRT